MLSMIVLFEFVLIWNDLLLNELFSSLLLLKEVVFVIWFNLLLRVDIFF